MMVEFALLKEHWGFPGGPMVKTLCFTPGGMGVIHDQGRPTCPEVCQKKKKKRKKEKKSTILGYRERNLSQKYMCDSQYVCGYVGVCLLFEHIKYF